MDIALEGYAMWKQFEEGDEPFTFDVGLDLSTVASPCELGAHDLVSVSYTHLDVYKRQVI